MPRKSITLNGFGGGLNKDSELSDINSEGRGEDELATCDNLFLDKKGKVVAEYPTIKAGDPSGGKQLEDAAAPSKLIIANNKAYMAHGPYAVQNKVNWSENPDFIAHKPDIGQVNDSNPDTHYAGVDLDVVEDTGADLILFQGKSATFNALGKGVLFNQTGGENTKQKYLKDTDSPGFHCIGAFIRSFRDVDTDGKLAEDADTWADDDVTNDVEQINASIGNPQVDVGFRNEAGGLINMSRAAAQGDAADYLDADDFDTATAIEMWHISDNDAWSVTWRGGQTNFGSFDSDGHGNGGDAEEKGWYGKYFPNVNKRGIRLEIKTGTGTLNPNIDYLVVYMDCGGTGDMEFDYLHGDAHDTSGKCWKLSNADLIAEGIQDGWTVLNFSWGSAYHTGGSFHPAKVKMMGIIASTDSDSNWADADHPIFEIRDFSIEADETAGLWNKSNFSFFQTSINNNGIESLPMKYGTRGGLSREIIAGSQYPFLLRIYKPSDHWGSPDSDHGSSGGGGRIYYQELDDFDAPKGEKLLLADWHHDKGVKIAGKDSFEEWDDTYVDPSGDTEPSFDWSLPDPPVVSTYSLESGYPREVESVNALWKTSAVVGRTIYIGNVAKEKAAVIYKSAANTDSDAPAHMIAAVNSGGNEDYIIAGAYTHPQQISWCNFVDRGFEAGDYLFMTGWANSKNNGLFKIKSSSPFSSTGTDASDVNLVNNKMIVMHKNGTNCAELADETPTSGHVALYAFEDYDGSLILKGAVGKAGGFPNNQYIDLELGADEIMVMEGVGDRLFVFTESKCIIVNVAQDVEFLEADMPGYGVSKPRQVTKVGEGLVVINSTGVHFFDGREFKDLTRGKVDHLPIDSRAAVMYDHNRKLLYCWFDRGDLNAANGILYYSFITGTWVGQNKAMISGAGMNTGEPGSNGFLGEGNKVWFEDGNSLYYIGESTNTTNIGRTITLETGKIHCGNISRNKKFYKIHVSSKNASSQVYVFWRTDESSGSYTIQGTLTSTEQIHTISLVNAKGKWIQVKIYSVAASSNLEIGDITITYREKTLK